MSGYDEALYLTYLGQVPTFRACSAEELRRVAALAAPRAVEAGETLVREGEPGDELFIIVAGTAAVDRGDEQVATLGPGDFFGELAIIDPAPRDATITATSTLTAAVLSRDSFQAALDQVPTIRDTLLVAMARRLRELDRSA